MHNVSASSLRVALLIELGSFGDALDEGERMLRLHPDNARLRNNLAWHLATCPDPALRDPERAVELEPEKGNYWGTLGTARYRAGSWRTALEALEKARGLRGGGDSFNWFFVVMAHHQLGESDEARRWFDKAVAWMKANKPEDEELTRFRAEAAGLLGIGK